jgi:hypothetical protein
MFILKIARQPIFQFLAIIIVLLITDIRPSYGITAAVVLLLWITIARSPILEAFVLLQKFNKV